LREPEIEATNWMGEQAMRPAVVDCKVWGVNRTPAGAQAQERLISVLRTCRRRAAAPWTSSAKSCAHRPLILPASCPNPPRPDRSTQRR
jgi:transposase